MFDALANAGFWGQSGQSLTPISIYTCTALTDWARHAADEIKQAGIGKRL